MSVMSPAPFYMHVGAENKAPPAPGLFDCCKHPGVWCTAIFCPCVVFASTRANNEGQDTPDGEVCAQGCSGACWAFGIAQFFVPCCKPLIYAKCIEDKDDQCADCGACCQWWCCFSCKATQRFRVSAERNSTPSPSISPLPQMFPVNHRGQGSGKGRKHI